MPRPQFIPMDPSGFAEWDGRDRRTIRPTGTAWQGEDTDPSDFPTALPRRQAKTTPLLNNGSVMPSSWVEALMQTAPGLDAMGSSEELIELAHAIEFEMQTLLTPREIFVVEAIIFEGLSLRDVAARWGNAWGKTQVARIRDKAFAKLAGSARLRELAGLGRVEP